MSAKIAFFNAKSYDKINFDDTNKNFGYEIKYIEHRLNGDTARHAKDCDVVCAFVNDTVDAKAIETLAKNGIKLLAMRCAGFNNVDLQACQKNGITVVRVPAYSPYAVAEHAVSLMLVLNRRIHRAYNRTKRGNFSLDGLLGFDMHGKTVGVIGTGKIGLVAIDILRGFGMKVLAFDVFENKEAASQKGFEYTTLDEIYKQSDIISLHCPLTSENKHMLNKDAFAKMKDGVMLINTSRGPLVNSADLIEALREGKVGGSGLDVYENETEYFFEDHSGEVIQDENLLELLTFKNVIITSHQAFFTREALGNISQTTLDNINDFVNQKELLNQVKPN